MKKNVLLLVFAFTFYFAWATPSNAEGAIKLSGRVVDSNGTPLVGAVIIIENSLLGTSTSANGFYLLPIRRPGEFILTASFLGYKKESKKLLIESDTHIDFTLEQEPIMGEAVIVSATRAGNRMPIAHTTINSDELDERKSGYDIPYLLELIPSVVATSEGGTGIGNTAFRIRGTDMTRINVTVNGIPINDPESQGVWWVNMPDFASSVDNVQIQRGVGTSTQGAGAFGGTVNFQTSTLNPEPFAQVETTVGSFNTLKTSAKAGTGLINDRFSFESRYSRVQSDGYIDRGWSDHQSLFVTGAWHTENSLLRFNLIHGEQHTGITWEGTPSYLLNTDRTYNPAGYIGTDEQNNELFYPNESDNYNQTHYHLIYSQQINRNFSLNISGFWIAGKGYYEQYKRNRKLLDYGIEPFIVGEETVSRVDMIRQKWLENDLYGITYSLNYNINEIRTVVGGGWNNYNNHHYGNVLWTKINIGIPKDFEWYRNIGNKEDYNFFAKSTYQLLDKVSLFGDIQYRGINYALSGEDDDLQSLNQKHHWDFFNPKGGVFYNISPSQEAFFSIGVAHREPSRADIKDAMKYGNNQTPIHEKLIDYELGYNLKSQGFALGINLYYMDYRDQLVLTGKLSDVGYPLMTNVPKSYRTGIELTGGFMPYKWLRWDANITLSENKIVIFTEYVDLYDSDWNFVGQQSNMLLLTDISFSPSVIGSSLISVKPFENLRFSLASKYVGSQYIDNTSSRDRMLNAYFVNNLKIDYNINLDGIKGIRIQAMVNNLFNEKYVANGWVYRAVFTDNSPEYREDGFFPQAGINFMGRFVVEF
jgi:iron complex outermembrane recepter protein